MSDIYGLGAFGPEQQRVACLCNFIAMTLMCLLSTGGSSLERECGCHGCWGIRWGALPGSLNLNEHTSFLSVKARPLLLGWEFLRQLSLSGCLHETSPGSVASPSAQPLHRICINKALGPVSLVHPLYPQYPCVQIKYVVEVAKALARIPSVARVDLLTRRICDPSVDASYGQPEEALKLPPMGNQPAVESGADGGMGGAYIVRLPCGPTNVYLKWVFMCGHIGTEVHACRRFHSC